VSSAGLPAGLKDAQSQYSHGIRTLLVLPADTEKIQCEWDANYYCAWEAQKQLSTYYEFEMGPQEWNTVTFLKKADNTIVTFSPPDHPTFHVPDNVGGTNAPYGEFAGADMTLHFEGFGELHGIPGKCFSTNTNEEADCGPGTRYVPAFSIPYGPDGFVTLDGAKKWVKWLEREIRFKRAPDITSSAQGISFGLVSDLPPVAPLTGSDPDNPFDPQSAKYAGAWNAEDWKKDPAVIHTIKQNRTLT